MSSLSVSSAEVAALDPVSLLSVAASSTYINSSHGLHRWLTSDMRSIIPHSVLVIARRASDGGFTCEVVGSANPVLGEHVQAPVPSSVEGVFERWLAADRVPITVATGEVGLEGENTPPGCASMLVHGVADERANAHYLYMFLGQSDLDQPRAREASAVLLPFIDCGCRNMLGREGLQRVSRPVRSPRRSAGVLSPLGALSQREIEIMRWVSSGKKNHEIAELLGLSKATVKNHLRRIFQKMDVMNRAQAVERFGRSVPLSAASITH